MFSLFLCSRLQVSFVHSFAYLKTSLLQSLFHLCQWFYAAIQRMSIIFGSRTQRFAFFFYIANYTGFQRNQHFSASCHTKCLSWTVQKTSCSVPAGYSSPSSNVEALPALLPERLAGD